MPQVNEKQAKDFLNKVSNKDHVLVLHHDDLDGFASGILFFDFCKKRGANVENLAFEIAKDQKQIIKQTRKFNKIIICDLAPNTISEILIHIKNKEVFYTDHHQKDVDVPSEILEYRTTSRGYIPSSKTVFELVGGKEWLSIAGTISDMGHLHEVNKEFLDSFFKRTKLSQKKFLETVVFMINKFLIYFKDRKQKSFHVLSKIKDYKEVKKFKRYSRPIEKEIQKHIKEYKHKKEKIGLISFYYFNPKYAIKSTVSSQLSFLYKDDLIVFAIPDKKIIRLSARTQNKNADMSKVLKVGILGLKNANAGGHIPAAGGFIAKDDLKTFKENLKNYNFD